MIPPARLFFITRFGLEMALQTVWDISRISLLVTAAIRSHFPVFPCCFLVRTGEQRECMGGYGQGSVRTLGYPQVIVSLPSQQHIWQACTLIRRYRYTGCAWLRPGYVRRTTHSTRGAFVAWRLIVWGILFLPIAHVWVVLSSFCTVDASRILRGIGAQGRLSVFTAISASIRVLSQRSTSSHGLRLLCFNVFFLARASCPLAIINVIPVAR
jgi:hypothetical protein